MNRSALIAWIAAHYGAKPEYLWARDPDSAAFRHADNQKWFALLMRISRKKLGLPDDAPVDVLNVKCDPLLLGSLQALPGIFPAYHMSKTRWINIALEGSADADTIRSLVTESYALTAPKRR